MLWPADLILAVTGFDPVADLRGTYRTGAEAIRIVRSEGGYVNMVTSRLAGLCQGEGDGVVLVRRHGRYTGGVKASGVILLKAQASLIVHDGPALMGWRV